MNIYSIKELVKATNSFLILEPKNLIKKNNTKMETQFELESKLETINKVDSLNSKIKIKPEIKDNMVNELYLDIKKKIKKNTLKLIIDEQAEIKNLKKTINFLKKFEKKLKNNYQVLKNNYELGLKNNETLKIDNDLLEEKQNQIIRNSDQLKNENKELKIPLKEIKLNLEESLKKNRSFEIHNNELKNTISRFIVDNKKLRENISLLENYKNSNSADEINKIKFYQDENVRLSSDLLIEQKNNKNIKENLNNIAIEKEIISNKIKELSESLALKSNIVSSSFVKESATDVQENIIKSDGTKEKDLDEVINKIFS